MPTPHPPSLTVHPARIFFACCLGFSAGILAASILPLPDIVPITIAGGAAIAWSCYPCIRPDRRLARLVSLAGLAVGMIWLGEARLHWQAERSASLELLRYPPPRLELTITGAEMDAAEPTY